MDKNDETLLENNGWEVECESPFEIRTKDGSFASGEAAQIVLDSIKYENRYKFTRDDMNLCFGAGLNHGVSIASKITKRDLGVEFPTYAEFMKRYNEEL